MNIVNEDFVSAWKGSIFIVFKKRFCLMILKYLCCHLSIFLFLSEYTLIFCYQFHVKLNIWVCFFPPAKNIQICKVDLRVHINYWIDNTFLFVNHWLLSYIFSKVTYILYVLTFSWLTRFYSHPQNVSSNAVISYLISSVGFKKLWHNLDIMP